MKNPFRWILPSHRILEKAKNIAIKVDAKKSYYRSLNDLELKNKTDEFIKTLNAGEGNIDLVLVDAIATVREAAYRETGMFAFFVQIIGAIVVALSNFAEMRTGEGKTLTLVLAEYVMALYKKGVHIVTVNQYLVERDSKFANSILNRLNMTALYNSADFQPDQKREAFKADVTYTTNSELGFDYLRDNMVHSYDEKVMRGLNFVIIDEADSVLIDEARTPLIIAGQPTQDQTLYVKVDEFVKSLNEDDYYVDSESQGVSLTPSGIEKAHDVFGVKNIYDFQNSDLVHKISNAIMAVKVFENGKEYIVQDDEIKLVDHFTGRIMEGRSYSNGLQQAIQAKEHVKIEAENVTVASITYQSLFRNYATLAAVSGTAITEKEELLKIYNLIVVPIPTNKPVIRKDQPDYIFDDKETKFRHVIDEIIERHEIGQPILVGTANVVDSEIISQRLNALNIAHEVLNAKNNKKEAEIVALAGQKGAITIATNMAGRGTDIKLGPGVKELGGLYVLGTEKNEARRIDQQLRGRSGRQGDPGESRFFLSLDDTIFTRYASDHIEKAEAKYQKSEIKDLKKKDKRKKDSVYDSRFFNWIVKTTQKKVEGINFDVRKNLLDYDQVLNNQRELIYKQRDAILTTNHPIDILHRMCNVVAKDTINVFSDTNNSNRINITLLIKALNEQCFKKEVFHSQDFARLSNEEIEKVIANKLKEEIDNIQITYRDDIDNMAKQVILQYLDQEWTKYLDLSAKLREGVSLRSLEQVSPLHLYVEESNKAFEQLKKDIAYDVIFAFLNMQFSNFNNPQEQLMQIRADVNTFLDNKKQMTNITEQDQNQANLSAKEQLAQIMLKKQQEQNNKNS